MLHFGSFSIRTDIFVLILSVALTAIQLLLCFKVKNKLIRLIPVILFSFLTAIFFVLIFVFEGWDSLGFLVLAICSAVILAACGIAWGIWWVVSKKLLQSKNTEAKL